MKIKIKKYKIQNKHKKPQENVKISKQNFLSESCNEKTKQQQSVDAKAEEVTWLQIIRSKFDRDECDSGMNDVAAGRTAIAGTKLTFCLWIF